MRRQQSFGRAKFPFGPNPSANPGSFERKEVIGNIFLLLISVHISVCLYKPQIVSILDLFPDSVK